MYRCNNKNRSSATANSTGPNEGASTTIGITCYVKADSVNLDRWVNHVILSAGSKYSVNVCVGKFVCLDDACSPVEENVRVTVIWNERVGDKEQKRTNQTVFTLATNRPGTVAFDGIWDAI